MTLTILGISGALRQASSNSKLLRAAATSLPGADYTEADLRMPLYDGDLEDTSGIPDAAQRLAEQIAAADGVMIATPEYNSGLTGVLKNALDWGSRVKPNPWEDKPVVLMSAAAGRAGGIRAQTMLRSCMTPFKPRLVPAAELALADGNNAFDESGALLSERYQAALDRLMAAFQEDIARGQ